MTETIVLLHGSAMGSASWDPVARSLVSSGATVVAPDLLGYGVAPRPTSRHGICEEVAYLVGELGLRPCSCKGTVYAVGHIGTFHVVAHSLGALIALHLRRALGARVTRMTLVDPLVGSSDRATLAWLAESPPPTTILVGENALAAPRAVARELAAALGATTVVVPGAGQMIPITHPSAVVDVLRSDAAAERQARGAYA